MSGSVWFGWVGRRPRRALSSGETSVSRASNLSHVADASQNAAAWQRVCYATSSTESTGPALESSCMRTSVTPSACIGSMRKIRFLSGMSILKSPTANARFLAESRTPEEMAEHLEAAAAELARRGRAKTLYLLLRRYGQLRYIEKGQSQT